MFRLSFGVPQAGFFWYYKGIEKEEKGLTMTGPELKIVSGGQTGVAQGALEAALDLGATPFYAFSKTMLPDIMPGVISGALMAFTMSLDDFIITYFTKGSGFETLSTLIYNEVKRGIQPEIYALSAIIFVVVLTLLMIIYRSPNNKAKEK